MSKSVLIKEYESLIKKNKDSKVLYRTVDVSFLDVLNKNEVEVLVEDYKPCLCKDNNYLNQYFKECDKCLGKGTIILNGHKVVCNKCKGEKYIRYHDCYLCNNEDIILDKVKIKLKLEDIDKEIVLTNDIRKMIINLNIVDKDDYLIKNNDIYLLRGIKYTKEDYKNKVSKQIQTLKGISYVKSEFKVNKEIVKLEGKGYEDGDFYFIFDNEVENEKKIIYTNVLIKDSGYVNIKDLIEKELVIVKDNVALNEDAYYIDSNVNQIVNDEYVIKLNKLNDDYLIENDNLIYILKLDKEDLNSDKKSIVVNGEKINVSYRKNLNEIIYLDFIDKGIYSKEGKRKKLMVKVIPYYNNIYSIKIKKNKDVVFVDDYKHSDNRLVRSFKDSKYLDDYIEIKDEKEIVVNNDLIIIERV